MIGATLQFQTLLSDKTSIITTYGTVDLQNFTKEAVNFRDIAHALSQICRFTGHTRKFFSVASHCLFCYEIARRLRPLNSALQLIMILHDAAEAYLQDLSAPVKLLEGMEAYNKHLDRIQMVIFESVGIQQGILDMYAEQVRLIDNLALAGEAFELTYGFGLDWINSKMWPVFRPTSLDIFLSKFHRLTERKYYKRLMACLEEWRK